MERGASAPIVSPRLHRAAPSPRSTVALTLAGRIARPDRRRGATRRRRPRLPTHGPAHSTPDPEIFRDLANQVARNERQLADLTDPARTGDARLHAAHHGADRDPTTPPGDARRARSDEAGRPRHAPRSCTATPAPLPRRWSTSNTSRTSRRARSTPSRRRAATPTRSTDSPRSPTSSTNTDARSRRRATQREATMTASNPSKTTLETLLAKQQTRARRSRRDHGDGRRHAHRRADGVVVQLAAACGTA